MATFFSYCYVIQFFFFFLSKELRMNQLGRTANRLEEEFPLAVHFQQQAVSGLCWLTKGFLNHSLMMPAVLWASGKQGSAHVCLWKSHCALRPAIGKSNAKEINKMFVRCCKQFIISSPCSILRLSSKTYTSSKILIYMPW